MSHPSHHVCAIVVTFNRSQLLGRCLRALQKQLADTDILVINNASSDDTLEVLARDFPEIQQLNLPNNVGGAGGFEAGMRYAYEAGYKYLWLMDDDGVPESNCLRELLQHATPQRVTVPVQQDGQQFYGAVIGWNNRRDVTPEIVAAEKPVTGKFTFAFVGPLIGREVVERVGFPRGDFFIWFDDFEYALRLHRHQDLQIVIVPQARFFHDIYHEIRQVKRFGRTSERATQAAWKTYYGTRNSFLVARNGFGSKRNRGHFRNFVLPFLRAQIRLLIGDVFYEPDGRERASLRLRGLRDGWREKMGKNH